MSDFKFNPSNNNQVTIRAPLGSTLYPKYKDSLDNGTLVPDLLGSSYTATSFDAETGEFIFEKCSNPD